MSSAREQRAPRGGACERAGAIRVARGCRMAWKPSPARGVCVVMRACRCVRAGGAPGRSDRVRHPRESGVDAAASRRNARLCDAGVAERGRPGCAVRSCAPSHDQRNRVHSNNKKKLCVSLTSDPPTNELVHARRSACLTSRARTPGTAPTRTRGASLRGPPRRSSRPPGTPRRCPSRRGPGTTAGSCSS